MEQLVVKMIISLSPQGQVNVEGIPDNAITAFGMLEIAKQVLHQNLMKANDRLVQPAQRIPS